MPTMGRRENSVKHTFREQQGGRECYNQNVKDQLEVQCAQSSKMPQVPTSLVMAVALHGACHWESKASL